MSPYEVPERPAADHRPEPGDAPFYHWRCEICHRAVHEHPKRSQADVAFLLTMGFMAVLVVTAVIVGIFIPFA